jgi:hypothetical protein
MNLKLNFFLRIIYILVTIHSEITGVSRKVWVDVKQASGNAQKNLHVAHAREVCSIGEIILWTCSIIAFLKKTIEASDIALFHQYNGCDIFCWSKVRAKALSW